jgi:subtilase family serine protease
VIDRVARSRTLVSFTGSLARIESVFHTKVHSYQFNVENNLRTPPKAMSCSAPSAVSFAGIVRKQTTLKQFR